MPSRDALPAQRPEGPAGRRLDNLWEAWPSEAEGKEFWERAEGQSPQRMKSVACHGSGVGGMMPAALPAAMHLSRQAILSPRVRMVWSPSASCAASSGALPWMEFQYWEATTACGRW